jgi:hypothetical protein
MDNKTKPAPQVIPRPNPPAPVKPTRPMKHVTESVDLSNTENRNEKK